MVVWFLGNALHTLRLRVTDYFSIQPTMDGGEESCHASIIKQAADAACEHPWRLDLRR
jgi:hypothetical protein